MKTSAPSFSPTIRSYADAEVVTLSQLAHVGGISRTQAHRQYHGTQPNDETLRRWAESLALPPAFRAACDAEIQRRAALRTPHLRLADAQLDLDFNHDGQVNEKDVPALWHKKNTVSEVRRYHQDRALDQRLTDDALAEDDRLRLEEEVYGRAGAQLLRRLARHG